MGISSTILFIGIILGITTTLESIMENAGQGKKIRDFGPNLIRNTVESNPDFSPDPPESDPVAIAKQYIEKRSGEFAVTVRISSSYKSDHNGVTHVYFQQLVNAIEVTNGVANVNVDRHGKIFSSGSSFYRHAPPPALDTCPAPSTAKDAVIAFAKFLELDNVPSVDNLQVENNEGKFTVVGAEFAQGPILAVLKYTPVDDGSRLVLVWDLEVPMGIHYYNAQVDTTNGNVIALHDRVRNFL